MCCSATPSAEKREKMGATEGAVVPNHLRQTLEPKAISAKQEDKVFLPISCTVQLVKTLPLHFLFSNSCKITGTASKLNRAVKLKSIISCL